MYRVIITPVTVIPQPFSSLACAFCEPYMCRFLSLRSCDLATKASIYDYFHFGNSRAFVKLTFVKDMCQMLTDGWHTNTEQLSHRLLGSPDSFIFDHHLYLSFFVRQMV